MVQLDPYVIVVKQSLIHLVQNFALVGLTISKLRLCRYLLEFHRRLTKFCLLEGQAYVELLYHLSLYFRNITISNLYH